jgi:hypothetical protein
VAPIGINLFLIVAGAVAASSRNRLRGLFLIVLSIGFYLMSSALRTSGGRYVQMIDWVWVVYFSIGLEQVLVWMFNYFSKAHLPDPLFGEHPVEAAAVIHPEPRPNSRFYIPIGVAILLVGAILPITEAAIKPRYTGQTKQIWLHNFQHSEVLRREYPTMLAALESIPRDQLRLIQGRALYPRYYSTGEGEPSGAITTFTSREYARLSFEMIGDFKAGVLLPLLEPPSAGFPNASDVLVIGCKEGNFVRALVVYYRAPETILVSSQFPDPTVCYPLSSSTLPDS